MTRPPPVTTPDALPLDGRVVVVTGGASGIGRGIAQAALGAGARVVLGDIDEAAGRACLEEWGVGDAAIFLPTDVADEAAVHRLVGATQDRFGRLDGLVNNAGIADAVSGPIEELALADWNRRLATNLGSVFLCCKHALPMLRERGGAIVNIASTRARQSERDCEAYAAAKGGMVALTHALAVSAGPEVRVNCISPGWIVTDAWKRPDQRHAPALSEDEHRQHPAGRAGTPEDVGGLAVWLLSAAAGFVTGQDFVIDGGMTKKMQYR